MSEPWHQDTKAIEKTAMAHRVDERVDLSRKAFVESEETIRTCCEAIGASGSKNSKQRCFIEVC